MTKAEEEELRPKPKVNGGKRPNGRMKKEQVLAMEQTMDSILPLENVWEKLAEKVLKGDGFATKLWLSYRLGNPRTIVEQTNMNINAGDLPLNKIKAFNKELENKY